MYRLLVPLIILIASANAASVPAFTFDSPAQLQGEVAVRDVQWLVIVMHDPTQGTAEIAPSHVPRLSNHTEFRSSVESEGAINSNMPLATGDIPWASAEPIRVEFGLGWSSLVIRADHINVTTSATNLELQRHEGFDNAAAGWVPAPRGELRSHTADFPTGFLATSEGTMTVTVEAQGLQTVEWHNATSACASDVCTDPGRTGDLAILDTAAEIVPFIEASMLGGTLEAILDASAVGGLGETLQASLNGTARFALAEGIQSCANKCALAANGTLTVAGQFSMIDVKPATEPGRLTTNLAGTFTGMRVDEQSNSHGRSWVSPAAAGGAGILMILLAWKAFLVLFSRLNQPLDHPVRRQLYENILANPGITYRELMRKSELQNGSVQHHIRTLVRAGLVVHQDERNVRRFFENHGRYKSNWRFVSAMRDADSRALVEVIGTRAGMTQTDIVKWGREHNLSRTYVQLRLQRLTEAGAVHGERSGRNVVYTISPEKPS